MTDTPEALKPWYKQPWLWFILGPLFAVMIFATSYAYLSVVTFDGMVKGDYAKNAKSFNIDNKRLRKASELGLHGELVLDEVTGDLRLTLSASDTLSAQQLTLLVIHPTVENLDQDLLMAYRPDGSYYGTLNKNISGKRYLHLMDQEENWRMTTEVTTPWPASISFTPNLP
ncbi:MAG: FixH family protein [Gammaproteobacteria bacterium]|jgi:hypothetical protein|nr:FixH family protein [Gammaproteobacteria bacterium]